MPIQYLRSDGSVVNETSSKQYVNSTGVVVSETQSTGITSTASWTEDSDVTSIASTIVPTVSMAFVETDDQNSVTLNVEVTSVTTSCSWTEVSDSSSVSVDVEVVAGTLVTEEFKNNTGTVLVNLTGLTVTVLNLATMAFVKTFTNQTTNSGGVMSFNDPLFTSATEYVVVVKNAAGVIGAEKVTAT